MDTFSFTDDFNQEPSKLTPADTGLAAVKGEALN